jgi:hypothetical protein
MKRFIRNLLMAKAVPDGEKKVRSAIAFFASEHERLTQKPLAVSSLHTYLTLLDHISLEKVGRPVFGRHFRRMGKTLTDPRGTQETGKDDCFVLILQEGKYMVKATKDPDLTCFSSLELDEMKRLVKVNALRRVLHTRFSSLKTDRTARLDEVIVDFVDYTREEARADTENAVMDELERNLFTKRKEVNEMTGLKLLIEKYETRLSELETQMSEVKRKLETVTEALRLLKEEGILEDDPKPHWP